MVAGLPLGCAVTVPSTIRVSATNAREPGARPVSRLSKFTTDAIATGACASAAIGIPSSTSKARILINFDM
jgi:hypothetical protein